MNNSSMQRGLITGLALTVTALGVGAAQAEPLIINRSATPATLDPAFVCDIADNGFIAPLYSTLLTYDAKPVPDAPEGVTVTTEDDTKLIGDLAESWSVSDDGKTITLVLRDGAKFTSGRTIDAAAVAASLQRALQSGACGTYFMEAAQFGNTASIEAADDKTVVITLNRAEPLVLHALTQPNLGIVDVAEVEANGGNDWLATNAAGSGPYILAEYQAGVKAAFNANPDYYGPAPLEPDVLVNFIPDNATLLLQARNGGADVTLGLSRAAVASLADDASLVVIQTPSPRWQLVSLPNQHPPFDNTKLREALSYATPYDAILRNVAHGLGELYFGPFPPEFEAFNAELSTPRAYDVDKAKALAEESGVSFPVQLEMVIREGQNDQEQIATILQGAWAPLGVEVSISKLPASGYFEVVSSEKKEAAIVRFDGPSVADPAWLLDYDMRCKSTFNTSNYCNAEAEALLDEAHPIADQAKRQEYWDKITAIWTADTPRIPIYEDVFTAVVSPDVTQWRFAQDGPFQIQFWSR
ncbi:MAG: ABC transporter substrate-binding protein [Hyphomicrobiales bacterium]|nr:ABC transporter substrate-binding protein [Hyphomicrobiales bacterium]